MCDSSTYRGSTPSACDGSGVWAFGEGDWRLIPRLRGEWRKLLTAEVECWAGTPSSCKGRIGVRFGPNPKGQTC